MKSKRRSLVLLGALILLTSALLTGCGGDDQKTSDTAEPVIDVRPITSSKQLVMPVASYVLTAADEKAYFAAVNLAQRRCADDFGVDTSIPVAAQPAQMELASPRRVGLVDREDVSRYGYHLPPTGENSADDKAGGWDPSERELVIMRGVDSGGEPQETDAETGRAIPEGGCSAEGFRVVDEGATSPAASDLVMTILNDAWSLTVADSRAQGAAAAWSECMAKNGYEFSSRGEAGNSVMSEPEAVQLRMAKLDLQCAIDTDYISIWYAVDKAYQERLIDENEAELQAGLAEQREVMDRVHGLLQEGA